VPITIASASGVYGFQLSLNYNPAVLRYESVATGSYLSSDGNSVFSAAVDASISGIVKSIVATRTGGTAAPTASGTLTELTFTVIGEGTSPLSLSTAVLSSTSAIPLPVTVVDASITPLRKLLGDITGDCTVNIFDLVSVGRNFGTQTGDSGYSAEVDLNSDGVINILDLVLVARNFGSSCS
ncbi:MAG TPA: cohesin domain-containing protein, partial [Candidatus Nanoarchaeia archaeon]|nr:cohesin domain-containing protein [Candidatus Nanoarchaeia archaeon]